MTPSRAAGRADGGDCGRARVCFADRQHVLIGVAFVRRGSRAIPIPSTFRLAAEQSNLSVRMHPAALRLIMPSQRSRTTRILWLCLRCTTTSFRIHKTLRTTPAMAPGITSRLWEIGDIVGVLEAWENTT